MTAIAYWLMGMAAGRLGRCRYGLVRRYIRYGVHIRHDLCPPEHALGIYSVYIYIQGMYAAAPPLLGDCHGASAVDLCISRGCVPGSRDSRLGASALIIRLVPLLVTLPD